MNITSQSLTPLLFSLLAASFLVSWKPIPGLGLVPNTNVIENYSLTHSHDFTSSSLEKEMLNTEDSKSQFRNIISQQQDSSNYFNNINFNIPNSSQRRLVRYDMPKIANPKIQRSSAFYSSKASHLLLTALNTFPSVRDPQVHVFMAEISREVEKAT